MRLRHPDALFAAVAALLLLGIFWSALDRPLDTGQRIAGTVLGCNGTGVKVPRWCGVQLDDGRQAEVEIPWGQPAGRVTVAVWAHRISGRPFYSVAYAQ